MIVGLLDNLIKEKVGRALNVTMVGKPNKMTIQNGNTALKLTVRAGNLGTGAKFIIELNLKNNDSKDGLVAPKILVNPERYNNTDLQKEAEKYFKTYLISKVFKDQFQKAVGKETKVERVDVFFDEYNQMRLTVSTKDHNYHL